MAENLGTLQVPIQGLHETLSKLTVPELQQRLKKRGLKRSGLKAKLVQRLQEAIENEGENNIEQNPNENLPDTSMLSTDNDQSLAEEDDHSQQEEDHSVKTHDKGLVDSRIFQDDQAIEQQYKDGNVALQSDVDNSREPDLPSYDDSALNWKDLKLELADKEAHAGEDNEEISARRDETNAKTGETYSEIDDTNVETGETFAKMDEASLTMEEAHAKVVEINEDITEKPTAEHDVVEQSGKNEEEKQIDVAESEEMDSVQIKDSETAEGSIFKEEKEMDDKMGENKEEKDETLEIQVSYNDKVDIDDAAQPDDKEIKRIEKKITTPVQIKKRKLTANSDQSNLKTETPTPRKRRWGSSASKESLTISSDSIKALMPDVSILPPSTDDPLCLGLDYGEMEEGEIDDSYEAEQDGDSEMKGDTEIMSEGSFKKEVKKGRIVRINTKDTVKIKTTEFEEKVEENTEKEITDSDALEMPSDQKVSLLTEISTDESHELGERSLSPAKNTPSNILSIFNLVRPFTLRQLRELLSKTGNVVEEGFWINKIKSHCYVTYETVEEATASRNALHGTKWPSGNPKFLSVDFAVNDVMYRETEGKLGKAASPPPPSPKQEERGAHQKREGSEREQERHGREKEKKERHKHREHEKENKDEEHSKQKEKKEAPAKLLDDLFRKTKATPSIYWLPLTKEQIAAKEKERDLRREERRKERQKEIADENLERENRRKQREIEMQRQRERSRERAKQPPPPPRGRRDSRSPKMIKRSRSPELPRRGIRSLPAQYRRRSPSSSSSS